MNVEDMLVIMPSFNEEKALPGVLAELSTIIPPSHVLVVNDGSTDGTSVVARRAGVEVVDLPMNMGIGVAVQTGYKFAKEHGYKFAIQCDADGQHPPAQIGILKQTMTQTGADMVIGSRFYGAEGGGFRSSFMRRQCIRFFSYWIELIAGIKVYDVTSGFRLCNSRAILIFADEYPFDYPEPESIVMLKKLGYLIVETPIKMRERQGGVSSIGLFGGVYYMVKVSIGLFVRTLRLRAGN
jgi:glycosyltransferase involved in cell wall biosynthesis